MNNSTSKSPFDYPSLTVSELTSSLYEVSQKLDATNKELLQLQHEQASLFTNLSHDLRSPLTAIRGSIDYLLSFEHDLTPENQSSILTLMQQKVVILDQLINDIFLLSQLESNSLGCNWESINIGIFLEEFYFTCEADIKYSKRHLELDVPTDFSYLVDVDVTLLYRVLDNLFTNALKYSLENALIKLEASKLSDDTILISVQDTGIGIKEDDLTRIFDRTYIVSSARTPSTHSCNGLGLSIAKSIILQHGGDIWCESKFGHGSNFYITLPIKR